MIRRPPRSTRTDTLFPYTTLFRSQTENIALYANLTYDILPNLELGAGFRLSRETKKATFDINGSTLPVLGIATGSFADKRKDEDFSPSVTLTYKLSPEISAYAQIGRASWRERVCQYV